MKTDNFKEINYLFNPIKYTVKGKTLIIDCSDRKYVIKPSSSKVLDTYSYLDSRGFNNYLKPLESRLSNDYLVYPYIYDNPIPYEQRATDLSKVVGLLHAKTSYHKEVDANKYDEVYNTILNNIEYLSFYYSNLYDEIFLKDSFNPFDNLFMDYYSKINNELKFCEKELDLWYKLVSDKKIARVSMLHGNLEVDHLIQDNDYYLISFDNSKIDTPVIELYEFYKKEYNKIDFESWFKNYLYYNELNEDELKLFLVLIAIPDEIVLTNNNFENVKKITNLINYINKTEELIRPYYFEDEKEEEK